MFRSLRVPLWLAIGVFSSGSAAGAKLKATFVCSQQLQDGSFSKLDDKGAWRISGKAIRCIAESKSHKLLEGRGVVKTTWHRGTSLQQGRERLGSPIGEAPYQYIFMLERGVDWDECATDITIPLDISDVNGGMVFHAQKLYRQDCAPIPVSPPVGKKKPSPDDSAKWDPGSLAQLPADAKDVAQQFIDAVVDSDPPSLATMAGAGVKNGKKTVTGADIKRAGFEKATGIKPLVCGGGSGPCTWGKWVVQAKGKSEFWLYANNDSGYGSFHCAVFSKKGDTWAWTAVKTYDTGEP